MTEIYTSYELDRHIRMTKVKKNKWANTVYLQHNGIKNIKIYERYFDIMLIKLTLAIFEMPLSCLEAEGSRWDC